MVKRPYARPEVVRQHYIIGEWAHILRDLDVRDTDTWFQYVEILERKLRREAVASARLDGGTIMVEEGGC